jgi:hypothetical protein
VDNPAVRNSLAYPQSLDSLSTCGPPVENNLSAAAATRLDPGCQDLSTENRCTIHNHFNSPLKPFDLLILFTRPSASRCWLEIDLYRGFL